MSPDYFLLPVALIILIAAAISMEKRGDSKTNSWMHTFGCWTAIIIAVWMLTWWGFHCVYNHDKLSTWITPNEFGDMFGALTCLFSGIAIAGVIAMLRQQHEEMKETRDEFAAQTEQFEEQTKQFNEQIELTRQAQKIDEFYRRIALLKQQIEVLTIDMGEAIHTGYTALYYALIAVYGFKEQSQECDYKQQLWNSTDWEFKKNTFAQILNWSHYFFELAHDYLEEPTFIKILTNSLTPFEVDFLYIMQETTKNHHSKDIIKKLEKKSNLFSSKKFAFFAMEPVIQDFCLKLRETVFKSPLQTFTAPEGSLMAQYYEMKAANQTSPED